MATTPDYFASLQAVSPLIISLFTMIATTIGAVGIYIGKKNSKSINEIHVIVNSEKTAMLKENERLNIKVNVLEVTTNALKAEIKELSSALMLSKSLESVPKIG